MRDRAAFALLHAVGMAGWKDFTEIAAWQHARALKLQVDVLLRKPDIASQFKFRSQVADAARSGPRNIAEGFARFSNKDFARFVRMAKASEAEVINHLIDALDQGMITEDEFAATRHLARRAMGAAIGLIRHLEATSGPMPPHRKPRNRNLRNPRNPGN
jgi:four helix bundle protein